MGEGPDGGRTARPGNTTGKGSRQPRVPTKAGRMGEKEKNKHCKPNANSESKLGTRS